MNEYHQFIIAKYIFKTCIHISNQLHTIVVSETNDKTNMQVSPLLASGIVAIQHSNKLPVCSMFYQPNDDE